MSSYIPRASLFRFGVFELDSCRGELRKYGLKVRIGQQALKLLLVLLQSPGQLVTREELGRELLPGDHFRDIERILNKAICQLRQVLGDSASSPRYIETLANQGYRFIPVPESASETARRCKPRRLNLIAVLPLVSEAVEPELGFVCSQVVCRLINKLSITPRVRVLAYNTVKHYGSAKGDPQTIGRNLGVQAVVAGDILRHGESLIVELELIDVADGAQLWGMQLTQSWPEAANNTELIADQIACELRPTLVRGRKPLQSDSTKVDGGDSTKVHGRDSTKVHGTLKAPRGEFSQIASSVPENLLREPGI